VAESDGEAVDPVAGSKRRALLASVAVDRTGNSRVSESRPFEPSESRPGNKEGMGGSMVSGASGSRADKSDGDMIRGAGAGAGAGAGRPISVGGETGSGSGSGGSPLGEGQRRRDTMTYRGRRLAMRQPVIAIGLTGTVGSSPSSETPPGVSRGAQSNDGIAAVPTSAQADRVSSSIENTGCLSRGTGGAVLSSHEEVDGDRE